MGYTQIDDSNIETLLLLTDAIVHEVSPELIKPYLDPNFPPEKLEEYLRVQSRPSQIPGIREYFKHLLAGQSTEATIMFALVTSVLGNRVMAPTLLNSLTALKDMSLTEREQLMVSWRDSPLALKRRLFKMISSLTINTYAKFATELHNQASGFPGRELRTQLYDGHVVDEFKYVMKDKPIVDGTVLDLSGKIDVLIIGSGSGAGVVAHTLANEGFKSLVLEKGAYETQEKLAQMDSISGGSLYESEGTLATRTQDMFILAGSTFGGGSTVNWSACLKTPFKVRKEWYDDHGIEWAANEQYDNCVEYVWNKMGATKENINHSFTNRVILEGSKKLGYNAKEVEQNNGNHPDHSCGLCQWGCKFGVKQGSVNCWFIDAATKGTEFMDQVYVEKITHKGGQATGVECRDLATGVKFSITGFKKVVVAGGSLNTPIVLQKSGFKNKHIGSNLKLHPVSVLFGDFGKENIEGPHDRPILTTVCTEVDDLDGKAHGAKVEAILHTPYLASSLLPWEGSDRLRQDLLKYQHLSALLLIDRDTSSGYVTYDKKKPQTIVVDYNINKFDRNALLQALLIGADMLYLEGAKEIITPQPWTPNFQSLKAKNERSINDKDYVEWRNTVAKIPLDTYGPSYGSAHQMSSCRISGKGPKDGAADLKGRLYECKNVYIADASAMPTALGANPMITTMALARLVSLGIVKDLSSTWKL